MMFAFLINEIVLFLITSQSKNKHFVIIILLENFNTVLGAEDVFNTVPDN